MKPSHEVVALPSDEVVLFLEQIGLAEDFQAGSLVCSVCGKELRTGGIGAGAVRGDFYVFACSSLDCLESFQAECAP